MSKHFKKKSSDAAFSMVFESVRPDETRILTAVPVAAREVDWDLPLEEGKLAVDVAETKTDLIVISTLAGAALDRIEVHLHNDLLTIRGARQSPLAAWDHPRYVYQECFWGPFSRSIVLPVEVKVELARAEYKNGILYIIIPKRKTDTRIPVIIVEE